MVLSYFFITITNPNYALDSHDIVQIYMTNFNESTSTLFKNVQFLYNDVLSSSPSDIVIASKYFSNINTSSQILTGNSQSSLFKYIDSYLESLESFICAFINNKIQSTNLTNVVNSYSNFMIFAVGYDITHDTCGDINKIYGVNNIGLITPFGKINRKILKNDINSDIMSVYYNNIYQCFIFNPYILN